MGKSKASKKNIPLRLPKSKEPVISDPSNDPTFVPMFGPSGTVVDNKTPGVQRKRDTPVQKEKSAFGFFECRSVNVAADTKNDDGFPEPEVVREGEHSDLHLSSTPIVSTPPPIKRAIISATPLISTPLHAFSAQEANFSLALSAIEPPATPDGTLACFADRISHVQESDNSSFTTFDVATVDSANQVGRLEKIELSEPVVTNLGIEYQISHEPCGSRAEEHDGNAESQRREPSRGSDNKCNKVIKENEEKRDTRKVYRLQFNYKEHCRARGRLLRQRKEERAAGVAVNAAAATETKGVTAETLSDDSDDSFDEYLRKSSGLLSDPKWSPIKFESPVRSERRAKSSRNNAATTPPSGISSPEPMSPSSWIEGCCTVLTQKDVLAKREQAANSKSSPKKPVKRFKIASPPKTPVKKFKFFD